MSVKYFLAYLLFNVLSYFFGRTILRFSGFKTALNFKAIFSSLSLGVITLVSIYALLCTGFRTSLIGVAIVLLYLFWTRDSFYKYKEEEVKIKVPLWQLISVVLFFAMFGFLFFYFQLIGLDGTEKYIHEDFTYWASAIEILNATGLESIYPTALTNELEPTSFYHYFEIWLPAIFAGIFNFHSLYSLLLIGYPTLYLILGIGAMAVVEKFSNDRRGFIFKMLLALSIFFVAPYINSFRFLLGQPGFELPFNHSIFYYSKLVTVYFCWIYIILFYQKDNLRTVFLPLMLCAFLYFPTLVPILPSFILIFVLSFLKPFRVFKNYRKFLLIQSAILIFVVGYMAIRNIGSSVITAEYSLLNELMTFYNNDITNYARIVYLAILKTGWHMVTYSPYILLILAMFWNKLQIFKSHFQFLFYVFALYVVAVMGSQLLMFNPFVGDQIYRNIFVPFFNVFSFLTLVFVTCKGHKLLSRTSIFITVLTILLSLPILIFGESKKQAVQLKEATELKNILARSTMKTAYIRNKKSYKHASEKLFYFEIPFHEVRKFYPEYQPICLSVFDIVDHDNVLDRTFHHSLVMNSDFSRFILRNDLDFNEITEAQLLYLAENRIEFLILEKPYAQGIFESLQIRQKHNFENWDVLQLKLD